MGPSYSRSDQRRGSYSRSDQRRGLAHAWYEIMVIFDPDTEEHTVQPTLEKHLK